MAPSSANHRLSRRRLGLCKEVCGMVIPRCSSKLIAILPGFNTVIDYFLAVLAAVELWQFFLRTLHRNPETSFWSQFCKISATVRSRRIWQTITLSGPLILSGCASIVKTYVSRLLFPNLYSSANIVNQKLKSLGDRHDFTYNIVTFVLWVK
jgi:hypothetical protein